MNHKHYDCINIGAGINGAASTGRLCAQRIARCMMAHGCKARGCTCR